MLKDLTVIDASTVLAGPSVGTFFAELGARVIKVENPLIPDVTRSWKLPVEDPENSVSAYFSSVNYKKEYRKLNLKSEPDYKEFLSLVSSADLLLTNFKFGDEAKLGIEDSFLRGLNQKLIIGKINGFGAQSDRVAYDLILQAESGFMSMNGTPESGPVKMPVALIDVLAAHHLKEGLLLALLDRERTGLGKTVHVSLYDAAVTSLINQASNYLMAGHVPTRIGSLHPNIAPYGELFETKDKATITFAIGSNAHFERLCNFLSLPDLPKNKQFYNNHARVGNRLELAEILQDKIKSIDSDSLLKAMIAQHVPIAKIKSLDEVFSDKIATDLLRSEDIEGIMTKRLTSIAFKWEE